MQQQNEHYESEANVQNLSASEIIPIVHETHNTLGSERNNRHRVDSNVKNETNYFASPRRSTHWNPQN